MLNKKAIVLFATSIATSLLVGCSGDEPDKSVETTTVTETVMNSPELSEASYPSEGVYFEPCDARSARATDVTSCPFAINVRIAYDAARSRIVSAYSPVTHKTYQMKCEDDLSARLKSGKTVTAVRCTGGNNAVVVVLE